MNTTEVTATQKRAYREQLQRVEEAATEWFGQWNMDEEVQGLKKGSTAQRMVFYFAYERTMGSYMTQLNKLIVIRAAFTNWEKSAIGEEKYLWENVRHCADSGDKECVALLALRAALQLHE